jgi:hypothetical protein
MNAAHLYSVRMLEPPGTILSEKGDPKTLGPRLGPTEDCFLKQKCAVVENRCRKQRGYGTHVDGARVTAGCLAAVSEPESPERLAESACGARFALRR